MKQKFKDNNQMVRKAIKDAGLYQWQVADLLGITEVTLSRWFRHEMTEDEQKRICEVINKG